VVRVRPDDSLEEAALTLLEHGFSALPVTGRADRLLGIISAVDLLRAVRQGAGRPIRGTVGAAMTEDVMTASPRTDIGIVAHRMRTYGEHRVVPIVRQDILVGVVTRTDLLRRSSVRERWRRRLRRWRGAYIQPGPASAALHDTQQPFDQRAPRTAATVMNSNPSFVRPTMSGSDTATRLMELGVTALPVVDGTGRLVGLVSEADLLHDPLSARRTPRTATVTGVMATDIVTVAPNTSVEELHRLLVDDGLRLVPVVEDEMLVGTVTRNDLLRSFLASSIKRNAMRK
jgi:CBS domain-containing protein